VLIATNHDDFDCPDPTVEKKYEKLQDHLKSNQHTWLVTGVAGL